MADEQQGDTQLDIFNAEATAQIRHVWHEGRWFFSVIDVVGLLTDAPKPRMYWADMKRNIQTEGFIELLDFFQQLKMLAPDGKQRLTDTAAAAGRLKHGSNAACPPPP